MTTSDVEATNNNQDDHPLYRSSSEQRLVMRTALFSTPLLEVKGWPEDDIGVDQLPRRKHHSLSTTQIFSNRPQPHQE